MIRIQREGDLSVAYWMAPQLYLALAAILAAGLEGMEAYQNR